MKHTVTRTLMGILLASHAFAANALTYTVTAGPTSSIAGTTLVDFGTSTATNVGSVSTPLPSEYTGGALFNTIGAGISGVAARPVGSTGNFWAIGSGQTGTASFAGGLSYYGFLWGSPDRGTWNQVSFYDGETLLSKYDGSVIANNNQWSTSGYFNVFAGQGEKITKIVFTASQPAFETDNHAYIAAVPEPETYGMLLTGLALIGFIARRRA